MAIAVRFDGHDVPREKYDAVLNRVMEPGVDHSGRLSHLCFEHGDGFCVVDVWESEEAFGRFGDTVVRPAFAELGIELPPPDIHPVHNRMGTYPADRNVESVKAMYEAFGRGDIPAILDHFADNIEWEAGRSDDYGVPWLKPGRGKDHTLAFFGALQALEFKRFEPTMVVGEGDRVLALCQLEAVVLETGRTVVDEEVHVWTFGADGKATSFRHVSDTAAHLAALNS